MSFEAHKAISSQELCGEREKKNELGSKPEKHKTSSNLVDVVAVFPPDILANITSLYV